MKEDLLLHIGTYYSGRYPRGSGKNPNQRAFTFLAEVEGMRAKGMRDVEIAKALGMNTTQFRNKVTRANSEKKRIINNHIYNQADKGMKNTEIAKELGISEGSVRNALKNRNKVKENQLENIADVLRESVDKHGYLDIGPGAEIQLGVARTKLDAAIDMLEDEEGLYRHNMYAKRLQNNSRSLTVKVLTREPDIVEVLKNSDKIRTLEAWTEDGGTTIHKLANPKSIDWDRVKIRYGDEGGSDKDGVIELRRGVDDLDLGTKKYAQVRIAVGGTHYLKGMAMYSDDIPKGHDIVFNTNKPSSKAKEDVLKELKDNSFNVFGATIQKQRGALNIVNEEGDWNTWSSKLSAQFLSKQPLSLIKERLDVTYDDLVAEKTMINSLTNPVVKAHLMESYADGLGSKARHLKVKGMANTKSHVLLPFPDMNPTEVYAPRYKDGDRVVLVRYPHGGIFEIPELVVNNKGPAKKTISNALDAIGIHPSVAQKLSGADFDGDTVSVIPNNQGKIKSKATIKELQDFDPIAKYQVSKDDPAMLRKRNPKTGKMESIGLTITPEHKQKEMGIVSNLITDMTIKGAPTSEIIRAVKHSMVVIDAEKHKLDYKQSAKDNRIAELQKTYQTHTDPITGKEKGGASTIISQSKTIIKQVGGKKVEVTDPKTGKTKTIIQGGKDIPLIEYVSDVSKLSSGTHKEDAYVDYIKKVQVLDNKTRKEMAAIKMPKRDPDASTKYADEVKSLNEKLNVALLNAPRERQAQLLATKEYHKTLKEMNYNMDKDQKKKLKSQVIQDAREKTGAKKELVDITDKEWEAIQSNAISPDRLKKILNNTDMDRVQQLAMPKESVSIAPNKLSRANALLNKGYTYAQVAEALGTSVSALHANLKVKDDDDDDDDDY